MRYLFPLLFLLPGAAAPAAGLDADAEAKALLQRFQSFATVGTPLADDFNQARERRLTGPVSLVPVPGEAPANQALRFPEDRSEAVHAYYGAVLPRRGCLSLGFRTDALPANHTMLSLCNAGTAGNTKFTLRLGLDRIVRVHILTKREQLTLQSEPVALGRWHHVAWWYGPEGSVLTVDGVIEDYATDYAVPYAVEVGEAFWLGDQPWWDAAGRKGAFYALDSFVGLLDNLKLVGLK